MEKDYDYVQLNKAGNNTHEDKLEKKPNSKTVLLGCGFLLIVGIGIVWKCWDGKRVDLNKLSTDERNALRDKIHEMILSPDSDQEIKIEGRKWIDIIDNINRLHNPVDTKNYVYPKGGDHGNLLYKPD